MLHMRVKEQLQKEKDLAFEDDLSFAHYLKYYMNKPPEDKPNTMRQQVKAKKSISIFEPLNNTHYQPLQGA